MFIGDIGLDHDHTFLGNSIRDCEAAMSPDRSAWANHAKIFVGSERVVEALWTVKEQSIRDSVEDVSGYEIWRYEPLTDMQKCRMVKIARGFLGSHYPWWKLGMLGVDAAISAVAGTDVRLMRRMLLTKIPFCSVLVGYCFETVKPRFFGARVEELTPDQIHDHVRNDPWWTLVAKVGDCKD